jgi:alpha-galactosidase
VVAGDRSQALYAYVQLATSPFAVPPPARLPGLDPARGYLVEPVHPAGPPRAIERVPPPWYAAGGVVLPGVALDAAGLAMPALAPEQALLLRVSSVPR